MRRGEGTGNMTFGEKSEEQIENLETSSAGMTIRSISDNAHLVRKEMANHLVIWCIDLEVEEQCHMGQAARQTIVMWVILELAKACRCFW